MINLSINSDQGNKNAWMQSFYFKSFSLAWTNWEKNQREERLKNSKYGKVKKITLEISRVD